MITRTFAAAAALCATTVLAAIPDYQIVEVYGGAGGSAAMDVNNNGLVVGCYTPPGGSRIAFKWQDGHRTDLGAGCATTVGDSGLAGGYDANGSAVFWRPTGETVALGMTASINGINAQDIAVLVHGETTNNNTTYVTQAYLWQDGQLAPLPQGCGLAINNANQVLCSSGIWKDGSITPFPTGSDGSQLVPKGLTDAGDTFGRYGTGFGYYRSATGTITPLPYGDKFTGAIDLNGAPLFLGDTEGLYGWVGDLNGHRAISTSDYPNVRPTALNARNWITGVAQTGPYSQGYDVAIVYIPKATVSAPPSTPGTPVAGLPVMRKAIADFNADGRNDPVWRDKYGNYGAWLMDGTNVLAAAMLDVPANSTLLFRGDFNADYKSDLVFQDGSGAYWITMMNGTSGTSTKILDGGTGWSLIGVWDFDGDGRTDLLWYHPSQGFGFWQMNGTTVLSAGAIAFPDKSWPAAIGDFQGHGHDDIAWMGEDGHVELWDEALGKPLGTIRAAGSGFVPAFVADFNFDYHADIVWRHPDGRHSLWLMNGATVVDSRSILDAGSSWHVVGTPDFNGDRMADLLFVADDGSVGGWTMSGTTQTGYALFLGGGSGWSLWNDSEVSGDFKGDLWWRYQDGSYGLWLMNGLSPASTKVMLNAGTGWEMVRK